MGITYPPLSIDRYLFIEMGELDKCNVNKNTDGLTRQHRIRTHFLLEPLATAPLLDYFK